MNLIIFYWNRISSVSSEDMTNSDIALDPSGNIYVTGDISNSGSSSLNGVAITGSNDAYVLKYTPAGVLSSTRCKGLAGKSTVGYSLIFRSGLIYVAGYTRGSLDGETFTGMKVPFVTSNMN